MNLKKLTFITAIFVLTNSFVFGQIKKDKAENELRKLLEQMSNAVAKYDASTLNKIFTEDYIEISPVGEFDSREKVLGFYTPEAKSKDGNPQVTVETDDYSIRLYNNSAIVIARLTYLTKIEGQPPRPPFALRVTAVCRQIKGKWKIASTHYTIIKKQ